MVSMTAIISAMATPSLLAPNDKSLKNAVESSCDHVTSCDTFDDVITYPFYTNTIYPFFLYGMFADHEIKFPRL